MSCYVDQLEVSVSTNPAARHVGARNGHQWCHLWADTGGELHAMASTIGLKPEWFQDHDKDFPHYDLTPAMRLRAIANGAQVGRLRDLIEVKLRQKIARRETGEEWSYRFDERIAMLCGRDNPTGPEIDMAIREANQWMYSQANQ